MADGGGAEEDFLAEAQVRGGEVHFTIRQGLVGRSHVVAGVGVHKHEGFLFAVETAAHLEGAAIGQLVGQGTGIARALGPGAAQGVGLVEDALGEAALLAVEHVGNEAAQGGLALFIGPHDDHQAGLEGDFTILKAAIPRDVCAEDSHDKSSTCGSGSTSPR